MTPTLSATAKASCLIVGDQDGRAAALLEYAAHLLREPLAQLNIQIAKGFVEQQQARPRGQRTRQRNALLLSTRDLVRIALAAAGETYQVEQFIDACSTVGGRKTAQAEGNIGGDVEMRKQGVVLEHHADAAAFRCGTCWPGALSVSPANRDLSALRMLETCDATQYRGFAATGAAEQAADLALGKLQREIVDHDLFAVAMLKVA